MGSSLTPSPLFISTHIHHCPLRHIFSFINSPIPIPIINSPISRHQQQQHRVSLSESFVEKKLNNVSWLTSDRDTNDDYNGWDFYETQIEEKTKKKKGFFLMGAGVSAAVLVAVIVYSSKGFKMKLNSPSRALQHIFPPFDYIAGRSKRLDLPEENFVDSETTVEVAEINASVPTTESLEKPAKRVFVTVAADSTQEEALQLLKKLKIIDDDVRADELCTRREYARWLVKANSVLERNLKHRISTLPSGSVVQAFDDINIEDPDFQFIQALAEAGIVLSKLSENNNSSDLESPNDNQGVNFYPESYISRLDLINWKAHLEYSCATRMEEISAKKVGFMDLNTISPEASSAFFMDMLAGDKSILRKVFGQSRRFQPQKPATKAQAAVAVTSGRMTDAIRAELLRLETENTSLLTEMEEIRSELLLQGEIQRFWEESLDEVKSYEEEMSRQFKEAIANLEQEKIVRVRSINENLKERAALDCQRKLLVNLKEEVDEMSERLACERADLSVEQKNLEVMLSELQDKQDAMMEVKSILEAEKEALRMLRSWIEDEARRSQARAQVLEQVGRRWKWNE